MADIQSIQGALGGWCAKMALSGASLSIGSGAWCWLDENYRVIATLGVIIGAIVGVTGLLLQHRANNKRHAIALEQHRVFMERLLRDPTRDDPPP